MKSQPSTYPLKSLPLTLGAKPGTLHLKHKTWFRVTSLFISSDLPFPAVMPGSFEEILACEMVQLPSLRSRSHPEDHAEP